MAGHLFVIARAGGAQSLAHGSVQSEIIESELLKLLSSQKLRQRQDQVPGVNLARADRPHLSIVRTSKTCRCKLDSPLPPLCLGNGDRVGMVRWRPVLRRLSAHGSSRARWTPEPQPSETCVLPPRVPCLPSAGLSPESVRYVRSKVASQGMPENRRDARLVDGDRCPRCGAPLRKSGLGRPPKWCSQTCRRAAYEERRAAARGVLAIEFVQPIAVARDHDLSECVVRVVASPAACRRVLQALTELARHGDLLREPRWQSTVDAIGKFADACVEARPVPSRFRR
jgi:hypothetical protein